MAGVEMLSNYRLQNNVLLLEINLTCIFYTRAFKGSGRLNHFCFHSNRASYVPTIKLFLIWIGFDGTKKNLGNVSSLLF